MAYPFNICLTKFFCGTVLTFVAKISKNSPSDSLSEFVLSSLSELLLGLSLSELASESLLSPSEGYDYSLSELVLSESGVSAGVSESGCSLFSPSLLLLGVSSSVEPELFPVSSLSDPLDSLLSSSPDFSSLSFDPELSLLLDSLFPLDSEG